MLKKRKKENKKKDIQMKTVIFTTLLMLFSIVNIFAAQPTTFAVGANTTSDERVAIEFGVHTPINSNFTLLILVGGTPFPKKSTDVYGMDWFDARFTLGVDLLVKPKRSLPLSLVLGIYSEHGFMIDRPVDHWDYQRSLLLGNVGIDLQFHKEWAIQITFRPGISIPYRAQMTQFTPDRNRVSIKLYSWVS